ncbi:MAG: YdcF family protein [Candidatus Limivicinus sp.]|jgi:uncharacterized SAM-binding protein YcdF (DUF218 family)
MDKKIYGLVKTLWDYMCVDVPPEKADFIVGFGCYNEEIALRAAELYLQGYAPKVLFSGNLGRNTKGMWQESEAERFAAVAVKYGVPEEDILIENKSTNTGENILFTKAILSPLGAEKIIGIHKPFMGRRLRAAMGIYWPEINCLVTSPQETILDYIALSAAKGMDEKKVIDILTGDFQRVELYAKLGYQIPQEIPEEAWAAYRELVSLGYTSELVKG